MPSRPCGPICADRSCGRSSGCSSSATPAAAQGEAPFTRLLPAAVDGWLDAVDERTGGTADPAMVRLGLAVTRGLLLDLVATGDDEGVDAAAARFAALLRRDRVVPRP